MIRALPLLLLPALAGPAPAQDWRRKVDQDRVNEAVEKACKFLLQMGGTGKFPHPELQKVGELVELSYVELVYLTLLHGGTDPNQPEMRQLFKHILSAPVERTYQAALQAMILQQRDPWKYQARLAHIAQFLVDNQCDNGQWSYGKPLVKQPPPPRKEVATGGGNPNAPPQDPDERPQDPPATPTYTLDRIEIRREGSGPATGDNSNSQYAALGLRACYDANIRFPKETISLARQWWESSQNKDGGWGYQKDDPSYASMTAGAVGSLAILSFAGGGAGKAGGAGDKGLKWLGVNFSLTENAKYQWATQHVHYWLYALERMGIYLKTEKVGAHEWFPEGVAQLLKDQKPNGSWGANYLVDTCFAVLFLRRATNPLKPVATVVERKPRPEDDE